MNDNEMKELIEKEIESVKKCLIEEGVEFVERDVRLGVYEDLRDSLKVLMSDVSY